MPKIMPLRGRLIRRNCVSDESVTRKSVDQFSMPYDRIDVPAKVGHWEQEYRLPELGGTPRQTDWARLIRHKFLSSVFANVLDATVTLNEADTTAVYQCLDK